METNNKVILGRDLEVGMTVNWSGELPLEGAMAFTVLSKPVDAVDKTMVTFRCVYPFSILFREDDIEGYAGKDSEFILISKEA